MIFAAFNGAMEKAVKNNAARIKTEKLRYEVVLKINLPRDNIVYISNIITVFLKVNHIYGPQNICRFMVYLFH
jgi:hypothetical protein